MNGGRPGIPWGRLIAGLIVGLATGLAYAWFVNPVSYVEIAPGQLKSEAKDQYVLLVGQAYLQDLNLDRARQRLKPLGGDPAAMVSAQADRAFARSASPDYIRALTVLAEALGGHPQAAQVFSGTAIAPGTDHATITPTFQAIPTLTPSPTALPPSPTVPTPTQTPVLIPSNATMKLVAEQTICKTGQPAGLLEVFVLDVNNGGIPAVKVLVAWDGGSDVFFTGLKPEVSPGYGDFQMSPNRTYSVTLVGMADPVVGISSAPCATDTNTTQTPTYQLTFAPVTNK